MCQVERPNDISNSNYTEREANTLPIQLQICASLVQLCVSDWSLAGAEFTSGLFLRLLCLNLPFPPPSPLGYLAKGLLAVM